MYSRIIPYFAYIKKYLHLEVIIYILCMISSVISLVNPILLQVIIDNVVIDSQYGLLIYILLIFSCSFAISLMINYSTTFFTTYIGQNILKELKLKIFNHIEKIQLEQKLNLLSGDFISKISDDTAVVSSFVTNTFVSFITYIVNILATGVLMVLFNKRLAILIILITVAQILVSIKFNNIIQTNQRHIREKVAVHLSFLNQFYNSFKHIRAYNNEENYSKQYGELNEQLIDLNYKSFRISFTYSTVLSVISYVGSIIIYGYGIYLISKGELTIGSLFVFDVIAEKFATYSSAVISINFEIQTVVVSAERVDSLLQLPTEDDALTVEEQKIDGRGLIEVYNDRIEKISVENIIFHYKDKQIFDNFSVVLERGKIYAFVGESGCGKTTLINLFLKMYLPESGKISFNQVDIGLLNNRVVREKISVAFQDTLLNESTLEENIRYGNTEVSFEDIIQVTKICGIYDYIMELPEQFQATVGELGDKISGGQKQRICLARALVRKADIYILDEIFSNVDKKLEREILEHISVCFADKIVVMISHNIDLVSQLNNIVVINEQRVESIGCHEELIEQSRTYRELYYRGVEHT